MFPPSNSPIAQRFLFMKHRRSVNSTKPGSLMAVGKITASHIWFGTRLDLLRENRAWLTSFPAWLWQDRNCMRHFSFLVCSVLWGFPLSLTTHVPWEMITRYHRYQRKRFRARSATLSCTVMTDLAGVLGAPMLPTMRACRVAPLV